MTRLGSWVYHRRRERRRRQLLFEAPPPAPAGWVTGPPNVVGVGAQKAGTTWWWALLTDHPDLHAAVGAAKELHYFDRFCTDPWTQADADRYHGLFPRPVGARAGEWTPRYASDVWAPPLLRRAAPDATLLLMLRDPVERYRSGLDHIRKMGLTVDAGHHEQALLRGHYAHQLRNLRRHFPTEQILVLQYERCRAEPEAELHRTLHAIGLAPERHPGIQDRRLNVTRRPHPLDEDRRRWLAEYYEPEVQALVELTDAIDPAHWPSFAHLRA